MKDKILNIAKHWHGDQKRKYSGEPYFTHLVRVAQIVENQGGDTNQVYAALLHDILEDTSMNVAGLQTELKGLGLSDVDVKDIVDLVIGLTDVYIKEDYPTLNRKTRKQLEAERLGKTSKRCQFIKCADLIDNGDDIVKHDKKFAKVYLKEKETLLLEMSSVEVEMEKIEIGKTVDSIWLNAWLDMTANLHQVTP